MLSIRFPDVSEKDNVLSVQSHLRGNLSRHVFVADEGRTTLFIVCMCVAFFFGSMIGTVVTAMTTDTVIYTMWKDGKNARGFIMSMLNIPIKFGSMIKSVILPVGLSAIGYTAGQAASASVTRVSLALCVLHPASA